MQRRLVHFCLIFLLAIGPVQGAFAGVLAQDHHAACSKGMQHDMAMHGMAQHDVADQQARQGGQCDCKQCASHCLAVGAVAVVLPGLLQVSTDHVRLLPIGFKPVDLIGMVPPTEIRPPISLQS